MPCVTKFYHYHLWEGTVNSFHSASDTAKPSPCNVGPIPSWPHSLPGCLCLWPGQSFKNAVRLSQHPSALPLGQILDPIVLFPATHSCIPCVNSVCSFFPVEQVHSYIRPITFFTIDPTMSIPEGRMPPSSVLGCCGEACCDMVCAVLPCTPLPHQAFLRAVLSLLFFMSRH